MRAHRDYIRDGNLQPGVFRAREGGMSVDWSKYSSAEDTRQRASRYPERNAVIKMGVGDIRSIPTLEVRHSPKPDNRAHADTILPEIQEDLTQARFELRRIAEVVIPLPIE